MKADAERMAEERGRQLEAEAKAKAEAEAKAKGSAPEEKDLFDNTEKEEKEA
jgi:hypothetical protein